MKASPRTIERTGLVAQAEEVGVDEFLFVDVEAVTVPFDGAGILLKNISGQVGDGEAKRCVARHAERGGVKSHVASGDLGNVGTEAVRAAGRTAQEASSGSRPLSAARTRSTSSRRAVICRIVPCAEIWIPFGRALTWMSDFFERPTECRIGFELKPDSEAHRK